MILFGEKNHFLFQANLVSCTDMHHFDWPPCKTMRMSLVSLSTRRGANGERKKKKEKDGQEGTKQRNINWQNHQHVRQQVFVIFVLKMKGGKTKKRMKEEEIEEGHCGPPTEKSFLSGFCRTWTKRYLIISQMRGKRVSVWLSSGRWLGTAWFKSDKIGRFCKTNFSTIFGKVLVRFRPVRYLQY